MSKDTTRENSRKWESILLRTDISNGQWLRKKNGENIVSKHNRPLKKNFQHMTHIWDLNCFGTKNIVRINTLWEKWKKKLRLLTFKCKLYVIKMRKKNITKAFVFCWLWINFRSLTFWLFSREYYWMEIIGCQWMTFYFLIDYVELKVTGMAVENLNHHPKAPAKLRGC